MERVAIIGSGHTGRSSLFEALLMFGMMQDFDEPRPQEEIEIIHEAEPVKLRSLKSGQRVFELQKDGALNELLIDCYDPNDERLILARSTRSAERKAKKRF